MTWHQSKSELQTPCARSCVMSVMDAAKNPNAGKRDGVQKLKSSHAPSSRSAPSERRKEVPDDF